MNLTNPDGPSALYVAASMGRTDTVRVLVEAGADVNYHWNSNPLTTALSAAAISGSTDTVRVLLEAGADATGWVGASALRRAIQFGDREMERMLVEAGADADDPSVVSERNLFDLGRKLGLVRGR